MQICYAILRCIFVAKLGERMAARQSARHDVARACFRFHDRHVRFARNCQKIVGASAAQKSILKIL